MLSPLQFLAKKLYGSLPPRLRILVEPAARVYEKSTRLKPEVWIVTGKEKSSQLPLTVCLCVLTAAYRSYISDLIFGNSFEEHFVGRDWLANVLHALPKAALSSSIIIIETDTASLHASKPPIGFVIPAWISGEIDLPLDTHVLRHRSTQSDIRAIERNSLTFEITQDSQRFEDFYDNMYVPYINLAHGSAALWIPKQTLRSQLEKSELLLVKKGEEYVSGILISYSHSDPYLRCLGVRDGDREHVGSAAVSAAYKFSLEYLEGKGFRKVHLGRSKAFLRDGVLRYKKKWSQRLTSASEQKFLLRIASSTDGAKAFLRYNPFIFEWGGELRGIVFAESETSVGAESLQRIYDQQFVSGLRKLIVFWFSAKGEVDEDRSSRIRQAIDECNSASKRIRCEIMDEPELADLNRNLGCSGAAVAISPR
jgi:hypothetical protein